MESKIHEHAQPMRVMGIAGSLRHGGYNRWLLEAARELAPQGMQITIVDLADLPFYNSDWDTDAARPSSVTQFKQAIAAADALLIATPEYNHNISGVLQNALEWASRPAGKSPLVGKPVAIMGAATGVMGTARAQQILKLVLFATLAVVMPHPGVAVGQAAEKFDAAGTLIHQPTRQFLRSFLQDLAAWTQRINKPEEQIATNA